MPQVHRLDAAAREALIAKVAAALSLRSDLSFAYLHGSFLHADGFRDVDVAVWTQPQADAFVDVDLAVQLTRLTGLPVDVRRLNQAPLAFVFHALQGRLLTVRDEPLLADLIERTARAYHDQAPLVLRATREAFAR